MAGREIKPEIKSPVGVETQLGTIRPKGLKKLTFWDIITSEKYFQWTLIIPLLLILAAFMLYPLIFNLYMSFHKYTLKGAPIFVGLQNYRELLHDVVFWTAFGRTLKVLVFSIVAELILGMSIALVFNRKFKGQNIIQGLCLLPLLISPLAMSLMWNYMLHVEFGIVNQILTWLGFTRVEWFSNPAIALYSVIAITVWQWTPFSIFVLLAGLKGIPQEIIEATQVDGASYWFVFRKLILPMLKPLIIIIVLLRSMWLIRIFDPIYGTTQGGVQTELLDWLIYRVSFVHFDVGKGSTMALVALYITIIFSIFMYQQLMKALGTGNNN